MGIFLLTYIVIDGILVMWAEVYLAHPDKNQHNMLDIRGLRLQTDPPTTSSILNKNPHAARSPFNLALGPFQVNRIEILPLDLGDLLQLVPGNGPDLV